MASYRLMCNELLSSQNGVTAKACPSHWQLLCTEHATTAMTDACHLALIALLMPALVVLVYSMSMWLIHHELWLRDPGQLHPNPIASMSKSMCMQHHRGHTRWKGHTNGHTRWKGHTNGHTRWKGHTNYGGTNPWPGPAFPVVLIACCKATRQGDMKMDSIN